VKSGDSRGLVRAADIIKGSVAQLPLAPKETVINPPPKPTESEFQNLQLSLFQDFLCNRDEEREKLSNAIDLWDSVPRYSVSRQAMAKARKEKDDNGTMLKKHTVAFQYRGRACACTITPARVQDLDDEEKDFYPSANEELVEDALRKLAADQQAGFFDKPSYRSGVVFSLYALREELKKRGHTRSYQEVRLALDILSGAIIEINGQDENGREVLVKSAYLPSVVAVSRKRLKDDPSAKWAVQFHPFVTGSIDKVTYRQFNYDRMMNHSTQLARWLHKQLVLKYTFADYTKPFEMRYSTVKRDSGLLDGYARERAAIEALQTAFKELKERDILSSCERRDITGPRKKLLDVVFKIWPSFDFVREVKAANKRLTDSRRKGSVGIGGGTHRNAIGPTGGSR
jgi:hypothetical protein